MSSLRKMLWVEWLKAIRSRMILWTIVGSLFMPLGMAFIIFVARNPQVSGQLGIISAKADMMAYAATDWLAYLSLFGMIVASGGFLLFSFVASWVFGREFVDGTVINMLAVPVARVNILLAKYVVVACWSFLLAIVILAASLVTGMFIQLPGGSVGALIQGSMIIIISACLAILVTLPVAFLASLARGYLLPIGAAIIAMLLANVAGLVGWGEYYPWAVPGLYATAETPLPPVSYWIVFATGVMGMIATYIWWKQADQSH